jgi:hypothetical protein
MKIVFFVISILVCLGSAQVQWQLVEFADRNVECLAQHPQDTSVILAAVADSLFHSTDGGSTWSFLTHFNGLPINSVVYDPAYCDTIYALLGNGSYSDGIYRSTDGGYNWSVLEWMLCPRCMVIPGFPLFLMLVGCDSSGIFKTEDGGNTWQAWNDGLTDLSIHALDYCMPFDTVPIFYAGTAHGLFYKSFDGWVQVNGAPTDLVVSWISYHHTQEFGFATFTGGSWSDGIYRSIDYGVNWQVVDWWIYSSCAVLNPLWQNYPEDTCSVLAGDSGLGVKYSNDCGTTWQEVNNGLGNMFVNTLSYHPQDSMRLYAATQGGLFRYQYGPGVVENSVDECNVFSIRVPTILRAGMQIPFEFSVQDQANVVLYWIQIYDATGRLERAELLDCTSTVLMPIEQSGVYFLKVSDQAQQYGQKIIVID